MKAPELAKEWVVDFEVVVQKSTKRKISAKFDRPTVSATIILL
jgi:hypothetical protein